MIHLFFHFHRIGAQIINYGVLSDDAIVCFTNGYDLTYFWSQTSGSDVTLSSTTAENLSFTAPSTDDVIVLTLAMSDETASTTDTFFITVTAPDVTTVVGALVINEAVAKAADGGNDWLEFLAVAGMSICRPIQL